MNQAPSYEELIDSDFFWLQVTPRIAFMNEALDGRWKEEPISSSLYYETNVTETNDGPEFPFQELRVDVLEKSTEEIRSLSGKYPIGYFRFYKDSASVTLMCRNELVSRMVSTFGMVKDSEINFLIALPLLPSELPNVYPVLSFQYRVRSTSRAESV